MELKEIEETVLALQKAEKALLDLPLDWQEEAAEKDIDTLNTSNVLSEIIGWLDDKKKLCPNLTS